MEGDFDIKTCDDRHLRFRKGGLCSGRPPSIKSQYDYFSKVKASGALEEGPTSSDLAAPPLIESKVYYYEKAITMEGRSIFLSTLQPGGGLEAKTPKAEALFGFQSGFGIKT